MKGAKLHDWVNEIVRGSMETRFSGPFVHDLELICEVNNARRGSKNPRNVLFAEVGLENELVYAFAKHICKYLILSYNLREEGD